jgi:hypothetical protein
LEIAARAFVTAGERSTRKSHLLYFSVSLMNKNRFRRVFSKRLGMLVAVAEDVASQGKAPGEGSAAQVAPASSVVGVISSMTAFAAAILAMQPGVSFAQALPTGGQVAAGQASISQNSNTMTINQGSQHPAQRQYHDHQQQAEFEPDR